MTKTTNYKELLEAVKDFLVKEQSFANDGAPENYAMFDDANRRLSKAVETAEGDFS